MEPLDLHNNRHFITHQFARWCAFSSTRSGAPLKSRSEVYPLIDMPLYKEILTSEKIISEAEFNQWHEANCKLISNFRYEWPIGWSAKLINVYLKTMTYIGRIGRPNLDSLIHPPIDGGLWDGIKTKYGNYHEIINCTHKVSRILNIESYETYSKILNGIKMIRDMEGWKLIEVEKVWEGTNFSKL